MDFLTEVDSLEIVEGHVQGVLKLEEQEAKALLQRYRSIRHELRDRLDQFPGDSFSAQRLRGVLAQVDAAIIAMGNSLKDEMKGAAKRFALQGVEDSIEEIKAFEKHFTGAVVPINLNAQLVALDTSNFLLNRYQSSIDAYGEDLRANLVQTLTNESLMETPYSSIVKKMGSFFQGEEWKLHRIARTELMNIYGMGKTNGMLEVRKTVLPDLKKTLYHPLDHRTAEDSKYVRSLELVVPLDEPFKYKWNGKWRIFYSVDRPNDRSCPIPYRKTWDSEN